MTIKKKYNLRVEVSLSSGRMLTLRDGISSSKKVEEITASETKKYFKLCTRKKKFFTFDNGFTKISEIDSVSVHVEEVLPVVKKGKVNVKEEKPVEKEKSHSFWRWLFLGGKK